MSKLALNGGTPINSAPLGPLVYQKWPVGVGGEKEALREVLHSDSWGTLGPKVEAFTKRFSDYQGAAHGIAVTNGTVTMEIALRAMDIGYGDEVIVPPYTFYATASACMMVGATPVFADITADTLMLDPDSVEAAITPRTKAIIPVYLGGRPCNMDRLLEIAKKHKLYIIEDAAQAHGSEWKGKRVGSIGDVGSFSFQLSKNLSGGEGGFLAVNDADLYERCWSIHNCGRVFSDSEWHAHYHVSTNARMTEWQAAILDVQMNKLDEQTEQRMKTAKKLDAAMADMGFVQPLLIDERVTRCSYHIYLYRYMGASQWGISKETFVNAMKAEGVPCAGGYTPLYTQPIFDSDEFRRITGSKIDYAGMKLPGVENASKNEAIFMGHSTLLCGDSAVNVIVAALEKIKANKDELIGK